MKTTPFRCAAVVALVSLSFAGFGCSRGGTDIKTGEVKSSTLDARETREKERQEVAAERAAHEERFRNAPVVTVQLTPGGFTPTELRTVVGPFRLGLEGAGAERVFWMPDFSIATVVRPEETQMFDLEAVAPGVHEYYLGGKEETRGKLIVE